MQDIVDSLQELLGNLTNEELQRTCIENIEKHTETVDEMINLSKKIEFLEQQLKELEQERKIAQIKLDHSRHMKTAIKLELHQRFLE